MDYHRILVKEMVELKLRVHPFSNHAKKGKLFTFSFSICFFSKRGRRGLLKYCWFFLRNCWTDAPRLLMVNLVTVKERILAILHIDVFKRTINIRDICWRTISLMPCPVHQVSTNFHALVQKSLVVVGRIVTLGREV